MLKSGAFTEDDRLELIYVHFAEAHLRPLPEVILQAQRGHDDPYRRVIAMLGARRLVPRGSHVAANQESFEKAI